MTIKYAFLKTSFSFEKEAKENITIKYALILLKKVPILVLFFSKTQENTTYIIEGI